MRSRNVIGVVALVIGCGLGVSGVHGQSAGAGNVGTKVGVINMLLAISSSAEGKQASAELQAQFQPRQKELEALDGQINQLQQKLNGPTLTDEERARITAEGTRLTQRMDRKRNEFQEDLNAAQSEFVNAIGRKMMEVINQYAQQGGYVEILDASTQNSPVLFAAKNIDITQDIIRLYDQAHPGTAATGGPAAKPAPAATKPAVPAASKP